MKIQVKLHQKRTGAYYTPKAVVTTLLSWAVIDSADRFLDPSCGDGQFIACHAKSVGIELDPIAARSAMERAPWALVHEGDFFTWAEATPERFTAVGGNPPFIRYQSFTGEVRARAQRVCKRLGADFSGLASSWPLFLVASAGLLGRNGRMAFVVPAEIGHAPYAAPLLEYLTRNFALVHIMAFQEKLFPRLSEDCWLLYAEGYGSQTKQIRFSTHEKFDTNLDPRRIVLTISISELRNTWSGRLRPFLLSAATRELYSSVVMDPGTKRLGEIARVGIGYVTGSNNFFHLRPSQADRLKIPSDFLHPSVRRSEMLPPHRLTKLTVERWYRDDEAILLLRIPRNIPEIDLPHSIRSYLHSEEARVAQQAFKCRTRIPWYAVPDVQTPDFFMSYMAGREPILVRNDVLCTCTNSLHAVCAVSAKSTPWLSEIWTSDFVRLSCEIEGHPLGGGMLKLEPREAAHIALPNPELLSRIPSYLVSEAVRTMRRWRHYGQ